MKKILLAIVFTVFSAFLGLFVLPREVSTTRWVMSTQPEEVVWKEISDVSQWNAWQPWATSPTDKIIPWDDGTVNVTEINEKDKFISFEVNASTDSDTTDKKGKLYIEKIPEGLWIRCQYSYTVAYNPIARLQGWMKRGTLALELDKGLLVLQEKITKNAETQTP